MSGIVYICYRCEQQLQPTDRVVQTIRIRRLEAVSGEPIEQQLVGEWFHERCWGPGVEPFREIDRGLFERAGHRADSRPPRRPAGR